MVEQPVNGVEKIVFVERLYIPIFTMRNVMREMKQYEGGVWTSKNTIKDGLLHQFQYTKLFVKDSSLLLAIQNGGATRQWGRKNSFR